MPHRIWNPVFAGILLLTALHPQVGGAAVRTSIAVVGGGGTPIGWWAERWGPFINGEVNLRYELSRGTGFVLIAGLSKSYLENLPVSDFNEQTQVGDIPPEFQPYTEVVTAKQGGAFKQIPVGFGFYQEGLVSGFRAYGSVAALVHLWKFDRSQSYTVKVALPLITANQISDNWTDSQDGANIGGQISVGILQPLRSMMFLDISAAYHILSLSKRHAALAYWGKPARTDEELLGRTEQRADFVQLRVGLRFGR